MRDANLLLGLWLATLIPSAPVMAASLKAGVSKVDITPPAGVVLWVYSSRNTPAQGTLDPLYARVLALEADSTRLALVALDLGRTFGPASIRRIREMAKNSSRVDYVLLVASHTHSGPAIQDEYASGTPAWESTALEKIGRAIDEACQRAVPARLGTGYGVTYIAHNRLRLNPDGTVTWFERNPTKIPTAPVDPTVSVLRVDQADGKPLAILVNYSCHAVVFGPDNFQYSADFPGVMAQTVERAFHNVPLCFFLQGAPGDINPYFAVTQLQQGALSMRDWSGQHLGEEATRVANDVRTESEPDASIQFAEDLLKFRLRWNQEKLREGLLAAFGPDVFKSYAPRIEPEMDLPVTTVLVNKRIALMGMPGEPFVDFQIDWRNRCPVKDAFFLGYANGYFGYFPTIRAATLGGYGAANSSTWTEPGAGERMVEHAVVKAYELLGKLSDIPEDLKKKE